MRDGNGGAELNQSRWWAGDVHEMSGLRDFLFLGAGQRCSSRCAVAGAGVKRTVAWWFEGAGFVVRGFTESSGRCGWECGVECRRGGYSRYEFSAPWSGPRPTTRPLTVTQTHLDSGAIANSNCDLDQVCPGGALTGFERRSSRWHFTCMVVPGCVMFMFPIQGSPIAIFAWRLRAPCS